MASPWRWLKCVRCGQLDDTNQGSLPYGECRDCRARYRKTARRKPPLTAAEIAYLTSPAYPQR